MENDIRGLSALENGEIDSYEACQMALIRLGISLTTFNLCSLPGLVSVITEFIWTVRLLEKSRKTGGGKQESRT